MKNNNGLTGSVDTWIPYKVLKYYLINIQMYSIFIILFAHGNCLKGKTNLFSIYFYIIWTITLLQSMDSPILVCNDWRYVYFSFNWAQLDSKEASRSAQWGCLSLCCRFPFTFIIHCSTQCVRGSYLWLADDFPQNSVCDPKKLYIVHP